MEIEYFFDPIEEFGLDIPKSRRKEALKAAAELIKIEMLDYIGDGKSPVSGGKWVHGLTKEYAARKADQSSVGYANLELSGDMLDSLDVGASKDGIDITLPEDQHGKAEGHLTGIYGENSKRERPRQFMPIGEQKFKRDILSKLKELLSEYE